MDPLETIPTGMKKELGRAAEIIGRYQRIHLVSHYDADGISSAAIVREALRRLGKETRITIYPTLSVEQMADIRNIRAECVVMTDLGTSYLGQLSGIGWDIVILDHHKPKEVSDVPEREGFSFVNPLTYGIDGSKNACGAAMAFLFALTLDPGNADLAPLAMAGMYGDKQHLGGFESIDKAIVDHALETGIVERYTDLAYPCGMTFNQAMMSCPEPYLKGTTGRSDKVYRFVKSCNLLPTDTPRTVPQESIDLFAEALAEKMRRNGVAEGIIRETFGERYYSERYGMDVSELSSILDGCGRQGDQDLAFASCDSLDFTEASAKAQEYSDLLIESIEPVFERMVTTDNMQYFVQGVHGLGGNIASAIVRYLGDPEKPVISVTDTGAEMLDISSRGTYAQVERGLNLSEALREVADRFGGQGGGHIIAAGASVPRGTGKEFLEALDAFIGVQFGR